VVFWLVVVSKKKKEGYRTRRMPEKEKGEKKRQLTSQNEKERSGVGGWKEGKTIK